MSEILTVRIDEEIKLRATEILRINGYTPSSAVKNMFEYVVKNERLPFSCNEKPDKKEILRSVAALDALQTKEPFTMTDEELRSARLKDRYGIDA